jgi:hypothetical protein
MLRNAVDFDEQTGMILTQGTRRTPQYEQFRAFYIHFDNIGWPQLFPPVDA